MEHNIAISCWCFGLRPINREDAAFVLELRQNPKLNRYLNEGATTIAEQERWLDKYFTRLGDYCFIIENISNGNPEGMISIYNVDKKQRKAEWGRWILRLGSLAAAESSYMIYKVAFEILRLEELYCRTLSLNKSVVAFHDNCGLVRRGIISDYTTIRGQSYEAVEHVVYSRDWGKSLAYLEAQAKRLAVMLARSNLQT